MIDFNDPNLVFEHQLRNYVTREAERANAVIRDVTGNEYSKLSVEFDSSDGGKWSLLCYVKNTSTAVKGAMLPATVDVWIRMFHAQHNIAVLPALITHSPASDDTSDVLRVGDDTQAGADLT